MGAHLAPHRGAPAGRCARSWTGPQLCPQLELHTQGQARGGPGSPKARSSNPRSGAGWPRGQAAAQGEGLDTEGRSQGSGEVPGGSRSSRNSRAALRHPWHVCRTWQQVWQPQYKPRPCRSLPGLQALQKEFKKQCAHTFHKHKGEKKKYISRFLSPERADPLLHPAMSQEAFYRVWVLIAATHPYWPEQVSLHWLSSPCFAGYLSKLCRLCCAQKWAA